MPKPKKEPRRYTPPSVFDSPPPRRFRWWIALAVLSLALAGPLWCRDRAEAAGYELIYEEDVWL